MKRLAVRWMWLGVSCSLLALVACNDNSSPQTPSDGGTTSDMDCVNATTHIEAMQTTVVVLVLPWLLLWSRAPGFTALRLTGAGVGGAAACGWVLERAFGVSTPLGSWVERAAAHGVAGLVVLAAMALTLYWLGGVSRPALPPSQPV